MAETLEEKMIALGNERDRANLLDIDKREQYISTVFLRAAQISLPLPTTEEALNAPFNKLIKSSSNPPSSSSMPSSKRKSGARVAQIGSGLVVETEIELKEDMIYENLTLAAVTLDSCSDIEIPHIEIEGNNGSSQSQSLNTGSGSLSVDVTRNRAVICSSSSSSQVSTLNGVIHFVLF